MDEKGNKEKSNIALRSTDGKSAVANREEVILEFWKENNIFHKTLQKKAPNGEFVFYEGPPTANAKPALHHLEARAFKDVIPRYKTMQGYYVRRRAGWDTHGLPVELQIEKKLGLTSKKEIEQYGIAKFNTECKESVLTYIREWESFTDRIAYWVDKSDAYYTFDASYIESLWNIVGKIYNEGLIYKDYKVVPYCPRCGTALASHELAQGYQIDKDLSVTAKFKIKGTENGYFLAWTTTPWTLPGNVALAVGADIEYIEAKVGEEILVLAKDRLSVISEPYEIIATHKGSEMAGMEYEPLYPFLVALLPAQEQEKFQNAYKIYVADFVTTNDGTGIVHTAVMYGQDDFELGTKVGLPKFHTVDVEGKFVEGTAFLEKRFVKDEDVAVDIIKDLAHRGLLFKKEKYEHSYPHCWRCKTPLIYYARDSWYIAMSKLREQLIEANQTIRWEPTHIRDGRFGEWLREVKDWAISRERYWGTPLPIWQSNDGERIIVDSLETLKKYTKKSNNTYFVMRHGQTENNVKSIWSCDSQALDPLTSAGEEKVRENIGALKEVNIDLIIASPYARTQETAKIAAEILNIKEEDIIADPLLGEWNVGNEYNHKPLDDYFKVRNASADRYHFKTNDGESYIDVVTRAGKCMDDLEKKYQGKRILIITHGAVTRAIDLLSNGLTFSSLYSKTRNYRNFENAEVRIVNFVPLPHNETFELDFHRPYIDDAILEKNGKEFYRVKEVIDVWFDSGAMPFAQDHYPFENKEYIEQIGFPADFISEAIDQTRGWFYTLHAIGILMGRGKAYKNVICLGHLLDAEGKKMSKSLGNIVEPFSQIDAYGVDTVRMWMYSVNQPGDSKNYDEKTVRELHNKIFGLLYNVISFYELYREKNLETESNPNHILDRWILSRIGQLINSSTEYLNEFKLLEPARAIRDFIDDLSTWYLRRSRDRIKDGNSGAKQTLYTVLKTLAQVIAPFAPFTAEDIWQKLKHENDTESVHLSTWPKASEIQMEIIANMEIVRDICTKGNALRKKENIPVRQPLQTLTVTELKLSNEYIEIIKEELNVKEVVAGNETILDTTITDDLKKEGNYRELIRAIQDLRKEQALTPSDVITLTISTSAESLIMPFMEEFKKTVHASTVTFSENEGKEVTIDTIEIRISIG